MSRRNLSSVGRSFALSCARVTLKGCCLAGCRLGRGRDSVVMLGFGRGSTGGVVAGSAFSFIIFWVSTLGAEAGGADSGFAPSVLSVATTFVLSFFFCSICTLGGVAASLCSGGAVARQRICVRCIYKFVFTV